MNPLERLQRAYNVSFHGAGILGQPMTWRCHCLRCPMTFRLVVATGGPRPELLEPLWAHARDHEEVTRKVRLARTKQPP